jgi:hypothetical protein
MSSVVGYSHQNDEQSTHHYRSIGHVKDRPPLQINKVDYCPIKK